jgi:hypothetical protein
VWEFQFLPLGFFSRLFVRYACARRRVFMLRVPNQTLTRMVWCSTMNVVERYSKNVEDEPGLEVVTYWTNGIIVRQPNPVT